MVQTLIAYTPLPAQGALEGRTLIGIMNYSVQSIVYLTIYNVTVRAFFLSPSPTVRGFALILLSSSDMLVLFVPDFDFL